MGFEDSYGMGLGGVSAISKGSGSLGVQLVRIPGSSPERSGQLSKTTCMWEWRGPPLIRLFWGLVADKQ
ncbi:hypothetical protein CANTEDRAFT_116962 [Yamadazyma tenuis ATCC 10573]|uniref:Uncharacterized protein n=1 Tax=Candida tenuis (strain ATCC 10573 / BCRC 21748 / CBS 615 / JCM 9827 / NBRC 10315 / NRRL Y-1498 / VKM Y-70) TaxID=590646 RepID=G3BD44_CANTC|nr:uncharacterized protein CANTEDRAFT_116962 [Yamadazyma tenuis ATCC 10573]EGV60912.1 hypothetical protein CANTEDRAFT_116962 [Yamadazyma tenuis ATCC 10573]